jgi:predicted nucleotidyltransferase
LSDAYLEKVRASSLARFQKLKSALAAAEILVAGKACVYATGSFGRMEAGPESDLDLFIVVETEEIEKNDKIVVVNQLNGIDEITLKYQLITAVENCGIEPFDGGGKYLETHRINDFPEKLGTREDDYHNTLTGRLLLLLESRPILGDSVYENLLGMVIDAYFVDFKNNQEEFIPAFLMNDILRMWRTFAVNYELFRKKGGTGYKTKNLKLKYSRMLTCYSAVIYLLSKHLEAGTVSPTDVRAMVALTPSERLEMVATRSFSDQTAGEKFRLLMGDVISDYSRFLEFTHEPHAEVAMAIDDEFRKWREKSHDFGRKFAEALTILGQSSDPLDGLYRIILI